MSTLATIVAVIALIGAVVSWGFGAWNFLCARRAVSGERKASQVWSAMVAWPFASRPTTGEAAVYASKVNKSLVAFIACLTVALTAISLATNLSRMSR